MEYRNYIIEENPYSTLKHKTTKYIFYHSDGDVNSSGHDATIEGCKHQIDEILIDNSEAEDNIRPNLKDYFPEGTGLKEAMEIYESQPELFKYAQALDVYIDDLLEFNQSQQPNTEVMAIFQMIVDKRNSHGWDGECCAILAEGMLKKYGNGQSQQDKISITLNFLEAYNNPKANKEYAVSEAIKLLKKPVGNLVNATGQEAG